MSDYTLNSTQLADIADLMGLDEGDIRTKYSGRGMNGATCIGIYGDFGWDFAFEVAAYLTRTEDGEDGTVYELRETMRELMDEMSSDNMGRSQIHYFRNLVLDTEEL